MLDNIHEYLCNIHCIRYGVSCVANLFFLLFSILLWRNEADGPQLYSARVLYYLILPSFSISARPVNL